MLTVLLFLLPVVQGYLNYAKYDAYNFLCDQYVPLCDNFLDEIGCDSKNRTAIGCPGYPQVPNNITNWVGKCVCGNPTAISTVSSSRITTELMSNRVVPDMYWLLEPWNTGPPYDLTQSYSIVCNLMLNRLGCPAQNQVVVANNQPTAKGKTDNFQCTCGKFKDATNAVNNLVIDQINKISLTNLPVFSDPVYLSVSVSIGMVLIVGKIFSIIAVYFTLPSVVGFLLAGLAMQNILSPMFLKGAGFPFPSPGGELKSIALIIILMRAGLSIKFDELRKTSAVTFFMCFIPYLGEFFTFMYLGESVFGYDIYTMGLFASIMAPLSPSIVIAGLLSLMATSNKDYGYTPKQVLIAAPLEVVISIILFGVFSVLLQTAPPSLYPWVVIYPLSVNIVLIPVTIIFSTCLGILLGYVAAHYINYRVTASEDYMWVRLNSNPQVGSNTAEFLFVMLVICYMFYNLCTVQYIQYCSGVLVVFSMSVTVSKLVKPNVLIDLSEGLKGIWVFAEAFLFTITGKNY